ncbi:MAG: TerC family protein [Rhodobiaceae bacterium]|nr:TerC family protein [Rhodobiaceae bacterium]
MEFLAEIPGLIASPAAWVALVTLVVMEVVLGIDNLIFISILTNKLPEAQRPRARQTGIGLAVVLRLCLLASIAWIVRLTAPLFTLFEHDFSGRDLILIAGGLFLVWKATKEIHHKVDPTPTPDVFDSRKATATFAAVIAQILILDVVFSLDSVITAVGMTPHLPVMVLAVVISVGIMLLAATPLADFLDRNPTVVMLALGFLLMIGMTLIADGIGFHVPKGYIYGAMAFSAFVEGLNIMSRNAKRRKAQAQES